MPPTGGWVNEWDLRQFIKLWKEDAEAEGSAHPNEDSPEIDPPRSVEQAYLNYLLRVTRHG